MFERLTCFALVDSEHCGLWTCENALALHRAFFLLWPCDDLKPLMFLLHKGAQQRRLSC